MTKKDALKKGRKIAGRMKHYQAQGLSKQEALSRAREEVNRELGLGGPDPIDPPDSTNESPDLTQDNTGPDSPDIQDLKNLTDPEPVQDSYQAAAAADAEYIPAGRADPDDDPDPDSDPEITPDPMQVQALVSHVNTLVSWIGESLTPEEHGSWSMTFESMIRQNKIQLIPWWAHLSFSALSTVGRRLKTFLDRRKREK